MYKLIGSKDQFAIQYEIIEVVSHFIYGRICYWIDGKQIGNFDLDTIISDVLSFLPSIIQDNEKREHKKFFEMDKEEVYYLLSGQAFFDNEKYAEMALEETWARFNIEVDLDVFGDVFIGLIDSGKMARIIYTDDKNILHEFYLNQGEVDEVFVCFYKELNAFYEEKILGMQ